MEREYGLLLQEVCLRRIRQEALTETPIAVRMDVSWLHEELFWARLAWLLQCSAAARKAYEQGIHVLQSWTPQPFNALEVDGFFERRVHQ